MGGMAYGVCGGSTDLDRRRWVYGVRRIKRAVCGWMDTWAHFKDSILDKIERQGNQLTTL